MTNGTLSLAALLPALPFKISALNLVDSRSLSRLMTAFGQLRAAKSSPFLLPRCQTDGRQSLHEAAPATSSMYRL